MGMNEKKRKVKPGSSWFVVGVAGILGGILLWLLGIPGTSRILLLLALLPGSIILTQLVYLASSRRKQYRDTLTQARLLPEEVTRLEDMYFGLMPLTFRYAVPAILVTVICATTIAALVNPREHFPWLYESTNSGQVKPPTPPTPGTNANTPTPGANADTPAPGTKADTPAPGPKADTPAPGANADTPAPGPKADTSTTTLYWPNGGWLQIFRAAALGFVGSYIYLLLMLTDRAFQRDITTGIATWAAAMPVLGLLMGGVTGLIVATALGGGDTSWTRDAIFLVAGMLPRQFAGFVQSGVQKMFQPDPVPTIRTLPLTTLRGVGPNVAARLEEEGIHDVSALAYASPHQLIRATTYAPRQIVDWIDEALLIATVPAHWEALERAGVTGALDLAWYQEHQDLIAPLAEDIKLVAPLLTAVVFRLSQDAQVDDLHQLYWEKDDVARPVALKYQLRNDFSHDEREALVSKIKSMTGVRSVAIENDRLTIEVDPTQREIDAGVRQTDGIVPQR